MPEKRFSVIRTFNRDILNPITKYLSVRKLSNAAIIYHIGRQSSREYSTPVKAVIKGNQIFIPLTYGPDTDWFLNIRKAGHCRVQINGKVYLANNPEMVDAAAAAVAFPNNYHASIKINHFLRLTIEAK